jgi:hypothetical protein
VLIKWWLLAIPHYILVALFAGGGLSWTVEGGATSSSTWAAG